MPKYLTIDDDLQIIPSDGCRFLSKSGKDLIAVESDVDAWAEGNPTHPRLDEAKSWLKACAAKIDADLEAIRNKRREAERALEDNIRWFVRTMGRQQKWSAEKIKQETDLRLARIADLLP